MLLDDHALPLAGFRLTEGSRGQWEDFVTRLEARGLPFAPTIRQEDRFDNPHLFASDDLVSLSVAGLLASLRSLPLQMGGAHGLASRFARPRQGRGLCSGQAGLAAPTVLALMAWQG